MKLEWLEIGAFGRLRGARLDGLGRLVVVYGPNEAGKSTVVEACRTVLYGFRPASRDANPYVPWGEDEARLAAGVRLSDGTCLEVERRLRSQATGRLVRGEASELLGNRPLPWIAHIPRDVFAQLFRLSPDEGPAVGETAWSEIQSRLIGTMGRTDIRPAREVAAELDEEADAIRRPNRRGKQALRMLDEERGRARARLREAERSDAELRRLRDLLAEKEAELDALREERARARALLDRAHHEAESLRYLERIDALRSSAIPPAELEGLPSDPASELRALQARTADAEAELERLEGDLEDAQVRADALTHRHRTLLREAASIRAMRGLLAALEGERSSARELRARLEAAESSLNATAGPILECDWRELEPGALDRVDVERLQALEAHRTAWVPPAGAGQVWALLTTGAAAVVAAAIWDAPVGRTLLAALAAVLLTAAGALAWIRRRRRRAEEEHRTERARLLDALPLTEAARNLPGPELAAALTALRAEYHRWREAVEATRAAEARATRVAEQLTGALARTPVNIDPDAPASLTRAVEEAEAALREAEATEHAAAAARRELERLCRHRDAARARLDEAQAPLEALRARLARLGEGDEAAGLRQVEASVSDLRLASELERELEARVGDLDAFRKRVEDARATDAEEGTAEEAPDEAEVYRVQARLERLDEEVDRLHEEITQIREQLERLAEVESPDQVLGELQELEERRRALILRHDRLRVLAALVRQADRRFREAHQPDVFRRAGAYLRQLTGGRYEVLSPDDDPDAARFRVEGPAVPDGHALGEPLSRATREQAYFALRMGILDHLDAEGERLPLFIDEALVHWDAARRAEALHLLAEAAGDRQVFVLTCHASLAEALAREGATRVDLPEPEGHAT